MSNTHTAPTQMPFVKNSQYRKQMTRVWKSELTPSQYVILDFIYDRTCSFNKVWEKIPYRHMLDGIVSKAGEVIAAAIQLGRTALINNLKTLESKGYIERIVVPDFYGNKTFKYRICWEKAGMGLPQTRAQKAAQAAGEDQENKGSDTKCTTPVHQANLPRSRSRPNNKVILTTDQDKKKELRTSCADLREEEGGNSPEITQEPTSEANPLAAVANAVAGGLEKGRKALARTAGKRKNKKLTATVLYDTWKAEMALNWEDARVLPWTPKERGCAGNMIKYLGKDAVPMIQWCIANWHMVRKSKFPAGGKVQFPEYPDFMFMFSFRKSFVEVWSERDFYQRMAGNPKAGLIVHLRKQGYTEEQATEIAEERDAENAQMSKIEQREAEVSRRESQINHAQRYVNRGATPEEQERAATNAARAKNRSRQVPTEFRKINTEISEW